MERQSEKKIYKEKTHENLSVETSTELQATSDLPWGKNVGTK